MFSLPGTTPRRPRVASSQSFTRLDNAGDASHSPTRHRANTVHTPTITSVPEAKQLHLLPEDGSSPGTGDIFESPADDDHDDLEIPARAGVPHQSDREKQLPIEIQSFSERFLKSLSAKSHASPLNIEAIADLFQDFYVQAETQIATHIAALSTRISREKSPTPSVSSRASAAGKGRHRSNAGIDDADGGEQQMLTATEISDKRKTRRLLELQRTALEEAVEKLVCERVYDKIYRHRTTNDEVRDAKLRSKTAALSLIGVGLKELHVEVPVPKDGDEQKMQADIYERLGAARSELQLMDQERCPFDKLQHLTLAHQSIVETLAHVFPSTSSADEVLPTLIYTLVTSPPESLNIASNLHFIQLFRSAVKMDGEAAYCLVNLEAAISFLETVDLSSLRTDSADNTSPESAASGATKLATRAHRVGSLTADLPAVSNPDGSTVVSGRSSPAPDAKSAVRHAAGGQRRLSHMIQAQAERIEARRDNLLQSADQAIDSINSTLENSFKFLFGRLHEQEKETQGSPVIIPKTLDEARRLVMSPTLDQSDEAFLANELSLGDTPTEDPLRRASASSIAGRLTARDPSVESSRSGSSTLNRRNASGIVDEKPTTGPADAVGSFVNSLNPLSRFGVPGFPKFGRSPNSPAPEQMTDKSAAKTLPQTRSRSTSINQEADTSAADALAQLKKAKPPIKRFLEVKDAKQLRLGEIDDLLKDYRRLAELLGEAITS